MGHAGPRGGESGVPAALRHIGARSITTNEPGPRAGTNAPAREDVTMSGHSVVAEIVRSGFVEGHHRGSVVRVAPGGEVAWSVGDITSAIYPRSCNKPVQAATM